LYFDEQSDTLYIGSNGGNSSIVTYDVKRQKHGKIVFAHDSLVHPAGMLVYEQQLYVLSQKPKALHRFDATTGEYLGVLASFDDLPEQIALSPC
jgi:hypothetical protein